MFRQRKPTLIERLPTTDLIVSASALRDRALDAAEALAPQVDAAREALGPKVEAARVALAPAVEAAVEALAPAVEAAREAIAPHVDAAKASVTPKVAKAREALAPKAEAALTSLGPSLALAANALDAARNKAESTESSRREAALRARLAAAALRGERPGRGARSVLAALGLGLILGVLAGILGRRLTTRTPVPSAFGDPGARLTPVPPPHPGPAAAPPPPAAPPFSPTPPVTRNDETAVDLTDAATGGSDPAGPTGSAADATGTDAKAPRRPRPRKDGPSAR